MQWELLGNNQFLACFWHRDERTKTYNNHTEGPSYELCTVKRDEAVWAPKTDAPGLLHMASLLAQIVDNLKTLRYINSSGKGWADVAELALPNALEACSTDVGNPRRQKFSH